VRPTIFANVGYTPGDRVWVSSGGVGWSTGEVLGFRVNRKQEVIVKVGYSTLLPGGWSREGERFPAQLRPRDPDRMGKDKPPTRGKERRQRCTHCHQLGEHLDFCETRGAA
jgi:hypothetical protein